MINTYHGVGINWGTYSTVQGAVGAFQSRDHGIRADSELVKDGGDTTVSKVYWDFREEATFTYVATQGGYNFGNAYVSYPNIASWVYVTDTVYPAISGYWLVDDVSIIGSNTSATRVTLKLSRYPNIQM